MILKKVMLRIIICTIHIGRSTTPRCQDQCQTVGANRWLDAWATMTWLLFWRCWKQKNPQNPRDFRGWLRVRRPMRRDTRGRVGISHSKPYYFGSHYVPRYFKGWSLDWEVLLPEHLEVRGRVVLLDGQRFDVLAGVHCPRRSTLSSQEYI